jgi:O-antigen/teichoic acid export membrane protein
MIKSIKKRFPNGSFARNVLTLMTGTTIAQAIPIAIAPILTRIYTPEDFGIFALYLSIASIIAVTATGGYESAIMLPQKNEDAVNLMVLSIMITCVVSFLAFLIVFIFNTQITNLLGNEEISNWLYFIPFMVLFTGIYQSLNYWLNRKQQYKRLATSRIVQSGGTAITNLTVGFSGLGVSGLVGGQLLGQGVATAFLAKMVWFNDKKNLKNCNKLKIFVMAKRYIDFLKYSIWSSLLNTMSFQILSIFLSKIFGLTVLGYYSLVFRFLNLPLSIIGSSISQVYFEQSTKHKQYFGNNRKIFISIVKKLSFISIIIFLPLFFIVEDMFVVIFGSQWREAGLYAQILLPLLCIRFISSTLSMTMTIYEKQLSGLLVNVTLLVAILTIFIIASLTNIDIKTFLILYVVVMSILYSIFLYYYFLLAKGNL